MHKHMGVSPPPDDDKNLVLPSPPQTSNAKQFRRVRCRHPQPSQPARPNNDRFLSLRFRRPPPPRVPSSLPQAKEDPNGLLAQPAAQAGAGIREEPGD